LQEDEDDEAEMVMEPAPRAKKEERPLTK